MSNELTLRANLVLDIGDEPYKRKVERVFSGNADMAGDDYFGGSQTATTALALVTPGDFADAGYIWIENLEDKDTGDDLHLYYQLTKILEVPAGGVSLFKISFDFGYLGVAASANTVFFQYTAVQL